ncbi:hypothetical protein CQ010_10575 [Arthrobacter sp. MYb211]|uniref:Wadjet anti-phage system protein JetD domain-containing protein n=1 Tax=unclassified Arthrobacter TaxID=235627 RepID=UPI000CFB3F1B|nr:MULTISPECIES: Wadjet anti-phage system protein JetD domain-containing protein [unclassified Arthrobacter]PRA03023.1 hypothetical protein CQ019_11175 [Arthrobacter sp. MYb229]PRA11014.1 hypothetical protein CQ015_11290 [Arthrobacter sp. MYb221]PRB49493.1 hypothetical protein CQ013_12655 [Arthrobacter sp. MYb216]PRC07169.1 hypothetical protein CQ010_10575 [Arthrobacter sp. MYb211]
MATKESGWTTVSSLRAASLKTWERGQLLCELLEPTGVYPRRRPLKSPNAGELRQRFGEAKNWVSELHRAASHYRIESKSIGHQSIGANDVPQAAWFDTVHQEIAFLGKGREAAAFTHLASALLGNEPQLRPWVLARPFRLAALGSESLAVAKVARWLVENREPGIYLRQLALAGVHTKFIEKHLREIDEMEAVLSGTVTPRSSTIKSFKLRHGFKLEPDTLRIRGLAETLGAPGGAEDLEMTVQAFASMSLAVRTVLVTENRTNFLAMPLMPESLVVFGAGYGLDGLAAADWVNACELVYWGDLDTHGFAILNQLRSHHGHVRSVMMDRETLEAHREFWGTEGKPSKARLDHLTAAEASLLASLRSDADSTQLRLEQEQINWGYAVEKIASACGWDLPCVIE